MQVYLEKFAFKAIFAAAVFVGAATLWLLTANSAAAGNGGGLLGGIGLGNGSGSNGSGSTGSGNGAGASSGCTSPARRLCSR